MATTHLVTRADRLELSLNQVLILGALRDIEADQFSFQKPTYDNIRSKAIAARAKSKRGHPEFRQNFDKCVNLGLIAITGESQRCSRGGLDTYSLTEEGKEVIARSITKLKPLRRAFN